VDGVQHSLYCAKGTGVATCITDPYQQPPGPFPAVVPSPRRAALQSVARSSSADPVHRLQLARYCCHERGHGPRRLSLRQTSLIQHRWNSLRNARGPRIRGEERARRKRGSRYASVRLGFGRLFLGMDHHGRVIDEMARGRARHGGRGNGEPVREIAQRRLCRWGMFGGG
jgi:hypothetical protein